MDQWKREKEKGHPPLSKNIWIIYSAWRTHVSCLNSLTTDLLWAAGSFLHHIQYVLSLSLAQQRGDGAAVGLHGHHGAILQALVQTAAASRTVPHLARGTRIALIIRAYWIHQSPADTLMMWQCCNTNTEFFILQSLISFLCLYDKGR